MRRVKRIPVHQIAVAILTVGLALVPDLSVPVAARATANPESRQQQLLNTYAKLPVSFVENRGQLDPRVRYYAQVPCFAFYLTPDAVTLTFAKSDADAQIALALRFLGGSPGSTLTADGRRPFFMLSMLERQPRVARPVSGRYPSPTSRLLAAKRGARSFF